MQAALWTPGLNRSPPERCCSHAIAPTCARGILSRESAQRFRAASVLFMASRYLSP